MAASADQPTLVLLHGLLGDADDWQPVADSISDLLSFFVVHLRGDYNENLCNAVVSAIFTLDHDLRQTARIRRQALLPLLNHD